MTKAWGRHQTEDFHQRVSERTKAGRRLWIEDVRQEAAGRTKAWGRRQTEDIHREAAQKTKAWRRIQTEDNHQEAAGRTKAGECSLANSEDAMATPQVRPGLLDVTEARLEVSLRIDIAGPEKDGEPKDLGEAHCNPSPRPKETLLQDRQEATPVQFKVLHDPNATLQAYQPLAPTPPSSLARSPGSTLPTI